MEEPRGGINLSLPKPDLDNKKFSEFVEEARKLIPGYSSEWTDHNLSDPGITFIDLFAWLSEIALYRINLVTETHRFKYLKLLGVEPETAKQAKVDLTFGSKEKKTLKKGTEVSAESDGKEILFRLEEDIDIIPATLEKIIVYESRSEIYDKSGSNEKKDLFFAPFGNKTQQDSALYLGFSSKYEDDSDISFTGLSLTFYVYEKDLKKIKKPGTEQVYKIEDTGLRWEILMGSKWRPVVPQDETEGFRKNGRVVFKQLEGWEASEEVPEFEHVTYIRISTSYYWLRCRAENAYYEYPPRIETIRLNTVSAAHGKEVKQRIKDKETEDNNEKNQINNENIFNGFPYPVLKLKEDPVLGNTLKITIKEPGRPQVEEWVEVQDFKESGPYDKHFVLNRKKEEVRFGNGEKGLVPSEDSFITMKYTPKNGERKGLVSKPERWVGTGLPNQNFKLKNVSTSRDELYRPFNLSVREKWIEVQDLEGSGPLDKHFILNRKKGEIKFGDGKFGLIPSEGSEVILKYTVGGGEEGNLPPERNWKMENFDGTIENYLASKGGKDTQTLEEAVEAFCRDLKIPQTAVTPKDFEQLALNTPGLRIASVKAVPNYNPHTGKKSPGAMTIVIIPYTPLEILEKPPEPSKEFKNAVFAYLDKHRLIGTEINIIPPVYVKVSVNVRILPMETFHDDNLIKEKVCKELDCFFHPVKGGKDKNGWPIGKNIYLSELYNIIEDIEGVNCILKLSVSGDKGASTDVYGNLILDRLASVYSGMHSIEIVRETRMDIKRGDSHSG